ncbi:MAG: EscR/YscR/HrcR family type III secretion system export apparatus protein [Chlamydiae bacterium]|nr:EscR/YscR/HrcR family type III secretion system export apparatus protein [Chlamydiota bacterium]
MRYIFILLCLFGTTLPQRAFAAGGIENLQDITQNPALNPDQVTQPPLVEKVVIIALLSLAPFIIMMLTSFMKLVVVLSLLRQAIGVQNSPPNAVISGMALMMTIYVMAPTALAMYNSAGSYIQEAAPKTQSALLSDASVEYMMGIIDRSKEPMRQFLMKNCDQKHMAYFYQLAKKKFPPEFQKNLQPQDFITLIPAYVTSQIRSAFEIGVLIYLPFFVIDLVTSNILLAMGMMMLSPLTIALPLKLLLLVMVDGWTLLTQGIVLTYR